MSTKSLLVDPFNIAFLKELNLSQALWCTYSYKSQLLGSQRQEDLKFEASWGKVSEILSQNQHKNKRASNIAQVVEAMGSILNTKTTKQENKKLNL
jgi:hypothetical protein